MIENVIGGNALPTGVTKGQAVTAAQAQDVLPPAQPGETGPPAAPPAIDRKELEKAAAKIQESIGQVDSSLKIEIDSDIHQVVVKVINNQSGEVIRQIPSQEMVEIAKRLDAMQGLLLTKRT